MSERFLVSARPVTSADQLADMTEWRNAVFALFVVAGLAFATWASRIPAIKDDLSINTVGVAVLLAGLAAGSIGGLSLSPAILTMLGSKFGLTACVYGVAAGLTLTGVGASILHSEAATLGGLVVFGFSYSSTDVLMNLEGAELERRVGKTILPLMHAFFSIGTVAGAGLGAAASAAAIPAGWNLVAVAAFVVLVATVAARFLRSEAPRSRTPASERRDSKSRAASSLGPWPDRRLILIGIMVLGMAFTEGSANDWLALGAVDGHSYDPTTGAIAYGVFVAAMTVGRIFGGPLIDGLGRRNVLVVLAALGIAGVLLFIHSDSLALTLTGAALWGLGGSLGFPVGISAAADHPTDGPRRVSVVATFGYGAFLVGPPVLGMLSEHLGILTSFYLVCALLILSMVASPAAGALSTVPTEAMKK